MAWIKQYQSKRWHKMRRTGNLTLCGKQAIKTRESDNPPGWHLACVSCLAIINKHKDKPAK